MNKKVIIALIALVVIVAVVAGAFFIIKSKKGVELNLEELNKTISEKKPFDEMPTEDITSEILSRNYEINEDEYEEVIGKMPMMNIQASMYLIIKAKDGSVDSVKQKVEEYGNKQEKIWSTYLPEQYDLVKQRKVGTVGNYVYLIISESASEIEKIIKK